MSKPKIIVNIDETLIFDAKMLHNINVIKEITKVMHQQGAEPEYNITYKEDSNENKSITG